MGDWGKLKGAQARATDRVFSRHLLARACKAPRLCRSPLMCAHPSNPTSNLSPAALFAPTIGPAQSLLTARESHVLHLLACAGMAVNTHGVHLEQAELLLGATAAPAVRFRSAGAGPLQAAGWWSHAVGSGATSSLPLTMIKRVFEHLRLVDFLLVCTSTGLLIDSVRGASRCVCLCFLSAAEMVGGGVG